MRAFQFWLLLLGSFVISGLMIKQILLEHELNKKRQDLVDSQEIANTGASFENAWKQLAMRIFQDSKQDQALIELLRKDGVQVRSNPTPGEPAPGSMSTPPSAILPPKGTSPSHP